jgi:ABC-2 type transport system ATP-binding protein
VKKRVGYAPETPPLYPDMDVASFLQFCARIKGIDKAARQHEIDEAVEKTQIGDVRNKLIARLSKGYRQRVGIAQAILGTPPVLILDEPTAGLDPKQITEIRDLIRGLGADHTVVLSTHILPEVAVTCTRVLIINKGRVVAEDTPDNLAHRLKGSRPVRLEIRGGTTAAVFAALRGVPGIANLRPTTGATGFASFDVEAEGGRDIRPDIARAVVGGGFDLVSLSQSGLSLEDVFLQLTTEDVSATQEGVVTA